MIPDNEYIKRLDEEILEPAAVELTITIQPVIYSVDPRLHYGDKLPRWELDNTPTWHCSFEVTLGSDKAYHFSTEARRSHRGKREGSHWEETIKVWQKQYDYIRRYVGSALLGHGELLAEEAHLARCDSIPGYDWEALRKEVRSALSTLASRYHEEELEAREKDDWDKVRSLNVSEKATLTALKHIGWLFARLEGTADSQVGNKSLLRFSFNQMEKLHRCYEDYREVWKSIASFVNNKIRANKFHPFSDDHWNDIKAQINQTFPLPDNKKPRLGVIHDNLLDELRWSKSHRTYKPHELAYVHAAIECGLMLAGRAWPQAENWRIIYNALRDHKANIGESVESDKPDR